jgi:hypothetical protein
MKEIDFYPKLCQKIKNYLISYFPENSKIAYSFNKSLDKMVEDIENEMGEKSSISEDYLPKLKLDILFGIKASQADSLSFVLFEVKYLKQLSLSEFSQLVGYLQVAKKIKLGVLLLIEKSFSENKLSNDFAELMRMKYLPMEWKIEWQKAKFKHPLKVGICYYIPNDGIHWIDSSEVMGVSSFQELASFLK